MNDMAKISQNDEGLARLGLQPHVGIVLSLTFEGVASGGNRNDAIVRFLKGENLCVLTILNEGDFYTSFTTSFQDKEHVEMLLRTRAFKKVCSDHGVKNSMITPA